MPQRTKGRQRRKEPGHKRFSPSKSKRWLNCPGSVPLSDTVPRPESSVFAREGTAAHKLAELCLIRGHVPDSYLGETIETVKVDEEMVEAVELYINVVMSDFQKATEGAQLHVEHLVEMDHIHPDTGGTADAIIDSPRKKLTAYDLKYGKGVVVEAEGNTQGMSYILGYATRGDNDYREYEVVIVQPRLDDEEARVKRWSFKKGRLNKFKKEVLNAIQSSQNIEDPIIKAGDWCRFCPAAAICPELHNQALEVAHADFTPAAAIDLKAPAELTPAQLLVVLNNASLISAWLKSVESYALGLLNQGHEVPGFKLVRGRSNRRWKDEKTAVKRLRRLGLSKDDIYTKPKLKSPAQVEKLVDDKTKFANLWEKGEGKLTIAPESDNRPAAPLSAQQDFNDE